MGGRREVDRQADTKGAGSGGWGRGPRIRHPETGTASSTWSVGSLLGLNFLFGQTVTRRQCVTGIGTTCNVQEMRRKRPLQVF